MSMEKQILRIEVPVPVGDEVVIVAVRRVHGQFASMTTRVSGRIYDECPMAPVGELIVADLKKAQSLLEEPPR